MQSWRPKCILLGQVALGRVSPVLCVCLGCLCIPRAQPQGQQAPGGKSVSCIGCHMLLVTPKFVRPRSKLKHWSLEQRKKTNQEDGRRRFVSGSSSKPAEV